jgi:SAM-dependent MidA family methyltransferase
MGSSSARPAPASPEFLAAFRAAAGPEGTLSFARFMELALYHPTAGYYRRPNVRVGRHPGSDFYTAADTGPLFGELVATAAVTLLGDRDPREFTFVEIGAEPGRTLLDGVKHPFGQVRTLRLGDSLTLAGRSIVFSNELFDAQPFVRTVFRRGRWWEIGVALDGDSLTEVERPYADDATASEGYHFDRPLAALRLLESLAAQPWQGLWLAVDYGKSLLDLRQHTPAGTARAYYRHTQSNDLLARPGEQDLTCHVCWDWMVAELHRHGFPEVKLEFQETFFVRHAGTAIARTAGEEAPRLSAKKLALAKLLHPSAMGQKFQVLHAQRWSDGARESSPPTAP